MHDREVGGWRKRVREHAEREGRELPADVVDELAGHLADEQASTMREGRSEDEARRLALQALNAASFGELSRRPRARLPRLGEGLPTLVHDVRHALRQLRRSPGFTATALVTLAIGIGANTAIFTLVHAVLLKSLPVAHADELYKLGDAYACCTKELLQGRWSLFSYPFYAQVRDSTPGFAELAATDALRPGLSVRRMGGGAGVAEAFTGEFVSGNYFTTLGVSALAGRVIAPSDDLGGAPPVAVASYAAWQRYGLDESLIGQPLAINGASVTLVGVTPPAFFGDRLDRRPPDFWLPLGLEPTFMRESSLLEEPVAGWLYMIGRLPPGAEPAPVQVRLTTALRNYLRVPGHVLRTGDVAKIDEQVVLLTPGGGGFNAMKDRYQQGLYLLLAVSAAVLLIACANIANLLLARGAARRGRTAVELAMGASRGAILRRHLVESAVLALAGGAAGALTAALASRAIVLLAFPGPTPVPIATAPSPAVLGFAFAVSLATAVLFGAGPAWLASRSDPADALRGSSRVIGDAGLPQRLLVVLQTAVSLALVTVAGLLTQSLRNLDRQPFGFEPSGRLVVEIDPQSAGYTPPRLDDLYRRLDDRLSELPGVLSHSLSLYTAQQGNNLWGGSIYLDDGTGPLSLVWDRVGARYFETIGTPIVRGRGIGEHDTAESPRVAVVNEAFARQFFSGRDPIGRRFGKYEVAHARDYEIVGVAQDARYADASRPVRPMFFVPLPQTVMYSAQIPNMVEESSRYVGAIELHVAGDPDAVGPAVRAALADVDPDLPATAMTSFPDLIRTTTSERTLIARLSDAFGAIALLLAAVGLYGVTAYRVARRRTEIGLRMALGATRGDIAGLVIRGAFSPTAVGVLIGIPMALLAARALQHQLFGVSPFHPPALALAAAVVAGGALFASALPARRAAAIAPMEALRTE